MFLAVLMVIAVGTGVVEGRTGGPDYMGYTFIDSNTPGGPTYNWIDIKATGTKIEELNSSDDSYTSNGNSVGFFFNFYGTDYSLVNITNNGIIFATRGSGDFSNVPINDSPLHNFIAPFWDDIVTWNHSGGPLGGIYYQIIGTAPNRKFIVEWENNQHYQESPKGITFEAILNEGNNNILFQYSDVSFGQGYSEGNNGSSATVGIEGALGFGLQYSYDNNSLSPGLAILFKYPQFNGTNLFLSKQAPASKDNDSVMTYNLFYNNFGDTGAQNVMLEDTLPVQMEFISASNSGIYDPITRKVSWNIGTVTPLGRGYENVTVRILQSVPVGTIIQNTANINTTNLEVRYDDNTATTQTTVTGRFLPANVTVEPNNGGNGPPSIFYGRPVNFTYHSCPAATGVNIQIHIDDGLPDITGSMTGGPPDWIYSTTFYPRHGHASVTYTVSGCDQTTVGYDIYIDPAGYIYDSDTGERISNATVTLQRPDGQGGWENVPTGQNPAISQPDVNPLITGTDGQYQWNTLAGAYRVHVEAQGYLPAESRVVNVPPPVFDLHVGLIGTSQLSVGTNTNRITVGIPDHIIVNVTYNNTPVSDATVTLAGTGLNLSNSTGVDGAAHFYNVTATNTGTITVNANKTGYTAGRTTIFARILTPKIAVYDVNNDDRIQKSEAIRAVLDYFDNLLSKQDAINVVLIYFVG